MWILEGFNEMLKNVENEVKIQKKEKRRNVYETN